MNATRLIGLWSLLVLLTLLTWTVGQIGVSGVPWALALLLSVWLKGHWIINDFMALRQAPRLWRWLLHGWLFLVVGCILLAHWISQTMA